MRLAENPRTKGNFYERSLETTFLPPGENEDNLERDSDAGPDIEATGRVDRKSTRLNPVTSVSRMPSSA